MYLARLAILDMYEGTPNQGMRCIQEIVSRFDHQLAEWKVFDVRGKAEVPDLSYDIYISTGGPGSPHEGDGIWDAAFYNWLQSVWNWNVTLNKEAKKQVFFICHSFQMAVKHFQLAEVSRRRSPSFGTFPVHMTNVGIADPLFEGLINPFWAADFRHWQVIQPNMDRIEEIGAEILALEKIRPHVPLERAIMAIRFSEDIFGVQFHPEADPDGMLKHFLDPERRKTVIEEHGEEKYLGMIEDLNDSSKIQLTHEIILPQFLNRAINIFQKEEITA
ncbi:MAG: GMP synthase [Saprospiraceae bacterium]|nr:GMP synthase [Saprospiraceae bacterium]